MLAKILQKTKGKPCTCPTGKICTSCKLKKVIPPHVIVEEPRRLPAPVSITYYNPPKSVYQNKQTIQYVDKPNKYKIRKKIKKDASPPIRINFCRWYKRRKALKELIKEKKEEDKKERKRKHVEYEKERMKELIHWEQAKQRTQSLPPPKTKKVYFKERSASARPKPKPPARSKYVTVKKLDVKSSISNRFVNYCYRVCCQLYCYLTCIILVVVTVIYIV